MRRRRPSDETLVTLRGKLEDLPARSAERQHLLQGCADLHGVSVATVYRALREQFRPRSLHRRDRGRPRRVAQQDMERFCELIAAMKLRTTNQKGRHLSTVRALELLVEHGIETPDGLIRAPLGLLTRTTVNRYLRAWGLDDERMSRPPPAQRFQAEHVNGHRQVEGLWLGGAAVVRYLRWMSTPRDPLYAGYRHPAELISYAVWLYFRFPLSLRMVEEMLAARGISVSYETIRQWGLKFGQEFANRIRRRAPRRGDKWHLDEVAITITGTKHWLWRAVDQEGFVLDVLVQSRRDKKAAKRLLRKLLKKQGRAPRVLITDKLRSYAAAKREIMPGVEHRQHKGLNNRAENSHQPTRRRERIMKRFQSPRQVQRFLSIHDQVANVFTRRPNQDTASKFRSARHQAFTTWAEVTGVAMAA